jgi:hypothetical protein
VGGYAPRARGDSVRPRRLIGASGRPLNFTARGHYDLDLALADYRSLTRGAWHWIDAVSCSIHRADPAPICFSSSSARRPVGFLLTLLMYLIPGATVGLLAPQVRFLDGVILGLLTAVVVWFEVRMQRASLAWTDVAQFAGFIVVFGVVVSVAGSLAAHWALQRVTSNNRWMGP